MSPRKRTSKVRLTWTTKTPPSPHPRPRVRSSRWKSKKPNVFGQTHGNRKILPRCPAHVVVKLDTGRRPQRQRLARISRPLGRDAIHREKPYCETAYRTR